MKKVLLLFVMLLAPQVSHAQEAGPVSVSEMVFCRGIHERMPVDADTHFPDSVGRVFCHTRIAAPDPSTHISHVWYYHDVRMAVVDLAINGDPWRTWSSKCIVRDWTGPWRVDVLSADGALIYSDEFFITAAPN